MNVSLLIVTHLKDAPWFAYCAKSILKYASGFNGVKVVVPTADVELFKPFGLPVVGFDEVPGKGFLSHMREKCNADLHFPYSDYVMHVDADCIFTRACTPLDFSVGGIPRVAMQPYASFLKNVGVQPITFMGCTGRERDFSQARYAWRNAAEFALGTLVGREFMSEMPITFKRNVYSRTRDIIASRFGSFDEYIMSCRNEFPQTFCEFNTLGEVAYTNYFESHAFSNSNLPNNPVVQFWSHGGFTPEVNATLAKFELL